MNKAMNALKWVFRGMVLVIVVLVIVGESVLPKEIWDDSHCEEFVASWKMLNSDGGITDITIPGDYEVARGEKLVAETVLPEDIEENYYLCFRSNRQDITLYVDNELRQKYSTSQSRAYGHSSPGAYVFLKIQNGDGGKTLRAEYQSDSPYSGKLRVIFYGDKMGIWKFLFRERGAEFIIAVVMLLLGIISVLGSLILRFCYRKPLELEYLGWGVMLAACWMISDSIFRQFIFPNVSIINDLAFVMVMLLPFPFLIYMNEVQNRRYNLLYVIVCSLLAIDSIVWIVLQFLNIVDFSDSISVFSGFCAGAMLLLLVTIIVDCFSGYIGQYKLVAIGIFGACLAAAMQLVLYFTRIAGNSGVMLAGGMIFLLAISTINTMKDILNIEKEKQQAVFANESKAQFLANMSHEIRTPINAVLGMDEIILRESTEPQIQEYAADIHNAGKSLLALINDILDFSKIESGKMEIVPVEYALSSLLSDCYNMINMRAKDKGLEFSVKNDTSLPGKLYGDEVRVRQVIVNLLTNAVKYTKEGRVVLSVQGERLEEGRLLLKVSVEDTGIGITKENCAKLFDSFQRVDEKRNRNIEGTGLGLAITMQLVQLMQGSLTVESEYGKGSIFRIELPQDIVDETPMGKLSEAANGNKQKTVQEEEELIVPDGKILVVDDVDMNLKVFCGLLKKTQIQIDTAISGKKALELASQKKYDIIFLDHMMPEMDGIETFRALKQMEQSPNVDTPVVMLTANAILGVREQYLQEGFTDYLSKPVQLDHLKKMIRKLLTDKEICKQEEQPKQEELSNREDVSGAETEKNEATSILEQLDFLDTKTGIMYCGEDEEFFFEMLELYLKEDKSQQLEECFAKEDWKQYAMLAHSLKSTSLSIGAECLSAHAKEMELAAKEGTIDYVQREHENLLAEYREILNKIAEIVKS